ncbi:MAG: hypothetical protein ACUVQP_06625 [Bacteroidales bacterium]
MEKDEENEVEREVFIQAVERMGLLYQCIDFNECNYCRSILEELDPYNPLLEVGFQGLTFTGGLKD